MSKFNLSPAIASINIRRNLTFAPVARWNKLDKTPADISSFGVVAQFTDKKSSTSRSVLIDFTTTPNLTGSYYIKNLIDASVTCVIGADATKTLIVGQEYFLQIYLTDSGKPVKDAMFVIKFEAGAIE